MIVRIVLLGLVVVQTASAAFERSSHGSSTVAMGGAATAASESPWGVFSNPGTLPTLSGRIVSFFYSPEPFGLKELALASFSYVEPTAIGTFAISGARCGFELYREVTLVASYSGAVSNEFRYGISLNYYSLAIKNYGSAHSLGFDVGALVKVADDVHWGFAVFNINAPTIGAVKERLPQVFSTGLSYQPLSDARLNIDVVKDIRFVTELRIGVEYTVLDAVSLRGGTSSDPSTLNVGCGLKYSLLQLDYAVSSHPQLGMTHQFSLSLQVGGTGR